MGGDGDTRGGEETGLVRGEVRGDRSGDRVRALEGGTGAISSRVVGGVCVSTSRSTALVSTLTCGAVVAVVVATSADTGPFPVSVESWLRFVWGGGGTDRGDALVNEL